MVTSFRTTSGVTAQRSIDNLQLSMQALQTLQDKLSSGKEIRTPSDDPSGATSAMSFRSDRKRTEQYSRNAQDGLGWLGTADNTLTASLTAIDNVRQLVLKGANSTSDKAARAALAQEVKTAKEGLIGLANTTYLNRPIFSGTANPAGQTPPVPTYADDGTYNGNDGAVMRSVGPNASVQVNFSGTSIFGDPAADDLWKTLSDIQTHLESDDPVELRKLVTGYTDAGGNPVKSDIDRIDERTLNITNRLSEIGARYHRVEQMQSRAEDNILTLSNSLSEVENIDLPKTLIALQLQETAYQSALSATAKVIQPSLVDFLR